MARSKSGGTLKRRWKRTSSTLIDNYFLTLFVINCKERSMDNACKDHIQEAGYIPGPASSTRWASGPGDRLEISEGPDGYLLRPRRIDYSRLGTLQREDTRRSPDVRHPQLSARSPMTQPYGIDTSVLVRLATAEPEPRLSALRERASLPDRRTGRGDIRLEPGNRRSLHRAAAPLRHIAGGRTVLS